jgi:hypothetical protein
MLYKNKFAFYIIFLSIYEVIYKTNVVLGKRLDKSTLAMCCFYL